MKDLYMDVLIEVPAGDLANLPDPTQFLWERMRARADEVCRENGARLRTDRTPEVTVQEARHPLLGVDMTLVASRWAVVAPDALTVS